MALMQLMPATAREFGVHNPFNPEENVRAGVAYLRQLLDRYQNNEELALAAYNAGPGAVDKHGQTVPPYRETRNYVLHVNQIAQPVTRPGHEIYKVVEIIGGQPAVRYTDKKPASGPYDVVGRR
jgi:hypothetical protein